MYVLTIEPSLPEEIPKYETGKSGASRLGNCWGKEECADGLPLAHISSPHM